MTQRHYSSAATTASVVTEASDTDTTLVVDSVAGWPSSTPFIVIAGNGTETEEVMLVTGVSGTVLTVTRGFDSTTAKTQPIGTQVVHGFAAIDFREMNAYINVPKTWGQLKNGG